MAYTILVVDDSAMVRKYVRQSLEAQDYQVLEAADGPAALDLLQAHSPALVISDINMAPMDGFELVANIRRKYPRSELPVLMLTTEADDEQRSKGRAVGANGWLVKPYDPVRMGAVIRHLLQSRAPSEGGQAR